MTVIVIFYHLSFDYILYRAVVSFLLRMNLLLQME